MGDSSSVSEREREGAFGSSFSLIILELRDQGASTVRSYDTSVNLMGVGIRRKEPAQGRKIDSMFRDFLGYPWVLSPVEFTNKEHLMELLPLRVVEPAEEKFKERQTLLNRLFHR